MRETGRVDVRDERTIRNRDSFFSLSRSNSAPALSAVDLDVLLPFYGTCNSVKSRCPFGDARIQSQLVCILRSKG